MTQLTSARALKISEWMKTSLWRRAAPATTLPSRSMVRMLSKVISSSPRLCAFMKNRPGSSGRRNEIWPRVKSSWPSATSTLPAAIISALMSRCDGFSPDDALADDRRDDLLPEDPLLEDLAISLTQCNSHAFPAEENRDLQGPQGRAGGSGNWRQARREISQVTPSRRQSNWTSP